MVLIAMYLLCRQCPFLLEQPGTSLMRFHPRFENLEHAALYMLLEMLRQAQGEDDVMVDAECRGLSTLNTWMACFGAPHAKRTELTCSDLELVAPLHRTLGVDQKATLTGEVTTFEEIVVTSDGRIIRKVTGHKEVLKGTQVYPKEYGREVLKAWRLWRRKQRLLVEAESSDSDYEEHSPEWPDALLAPCLSQFKHVTRCPRLW